MARCQGTVFPAFLLALTFGVVGPLQMYLTNSTELWFRINDIWWLCLLGGVAIFVLCLFLGILLPENWRVFWDCLLFGVALGMYLQGNYINADYGVLDGRAIDWFQYRDIAVVNTAIWLVCLFIPLVATHLCPEMAKKGFKWGAQFLIAVQILAFGITLATTNLDRGENAVLSVKGINEVSEQGNVIVFVLDTFDDQDMKELLKTDPNFFSDLDGFTYFENNTGMYSTTKGSIPFILTGEVYRNEQPYNSYVEEAFLKTDFFRELKKDGYDIGLYTQNNLIGFSSCKDYVSNLALSEVKISSPIKMLGLLYKFTGFRYFPHLLKPSVWIYSSEFDGCKETEKSDSTIYSLDNLSYYNRLTQEQLSLVETGKCYRFIHLYGSHAPYTLTENLQKAEDGSATCISQSKASLKIVYEYIKQLKELGVYDQSTLLILSDHGRMLGEPRNPIFFCKERNSRGPLRATNAPVCQEDIQATIMSDLGINDDGKYGQSAFDVDEGEERDRRFLYYNWGGDWSAEYLPPLIEYSISSVGNAPEDFYITQYDIKDYTMGTELSFISGEGPDANLYGIYGFSYAEKTCTWTEGNQAEMAFRLDVSPGQDLLVHMDVVNTLYGSQRLTILANDTLVYGGDSFDNRPIEFKVLKEVLTDNVLKLVFKFPDAESRGGGDTRKVAVAFSGMCIQSIEPQADVYCLGTELSFKKESGTAHSYCDVGFSYPEDTHTWTEGHFARLRFQIDPKPQKDILVQMDVLNTNYGEQTCIVRANGSEVYRGKIAGNQKLEFTIPLHLLKNPILALEFELPDAISQHEIDGGADNRRVAIAFAGMRLLER